jgi:hypothetical protein
VYEAALALVTETMRYLLTDIRQSAYISRIAAQRRFMKRVRPTRGILLSIIVTLFLAPPAFASSRDIAREPAQKKQATRKITPQKMTMTPQGNPTINLTQDPGPGDTEGGGNYSYCLARGSLGQKCRDVVTFYKQGTICELGCRKCASVQFSASCSCNPENLTLTGTCTYW